jgi:hypothetical protein
LRPLGRSRGIDSNAALGARPFLTVDPLILTVDPFDVESVFSPLGLDRLERAISLLREISEQLRRREEQDDGEHQQAG